MDTYTTSDARDLLEWRSRHRRLAHYAHQHLDSRQAAGEYKLENRTGARPQDIEAAVRSEMDNQLEIGRCQELIDAAVAWAARQPVSSYINVAYEHGSVNRSFGELLSSGVFDARSDFDTEMTDEDRAAVDTFLALAILADILADDGYVDPTVDRNRRS